MAEEPYALFHYYRLSIDQIRLLRLYRDENGRIIGSLKSVPISELLNKDLEKRTKYTTLSYYWGKNKATRQIFLSHTPLGAGPEAPLKAVPQELASLELRESLYSILEVICQDADMSDDWWWIDAICIDQGDDEESQKEREGQLRLVGDIYKHCARAIVWLGAGSEDDLTAINTSTTPSGEVAIKFLHHLRQYSTRFETTTEQVDLAEKLSVYGKEWIAVQRLLQRPWFTRVWTVQEFLLPPELSYSCGKYAINKSQFRDAIYTIYLCRQIKQTLIPWTTFASAWNRRRLLQWSKIKARESMSLVSLLAYGSDSKATYERDRIYSLLGLAWDYRIIGDPNNQISVAQLYTKLARAFIDKHWSLDIVCLKHAFHATEWAMPSWVPDWRAGSESFVVPAMASQSWVPDRRESSDSYLAPSIKRQRASPRLPIGNLRPKRHIPLDPDAVSYAAAGHGPLQVTWTFSHDSKIITCRGILVDYVDGLGVPEKIHHKDVRKRVELSSASENTELSVMHQERIVEFLEILSRCLVLDRRDKYLTYPAPQWYYYEEFREECLSSLGKGPEEQSIFGAWLQLNKSQIFRGRSLETLVLLTPTPSQQQKRRILEPTNHINKQYDFIANFEDKVTNMKRVLVTTDSGNIGMGPSDAKKGDQIVVLLGCNIPLILREEDDGSSYNVIGECYLHGLMNGEALDIEDESRHRKFRLS